MKKSAYSNRLRIVQGLLREIRTAAELRQADLAQKLGHPQSFVSKFESGDRCLDLLQLEQVCDAIGIPLSEFVRRYEEARR